MLPRNPDLSRVLGFLAGIRPYREGGIRLEAERWGERWLIHNYGHGGGGITLAPGAALMAAELVGERVPAGARVAVLGAGIIGLSTAVELQARGYRVRVYARELPPHTTSDVAGGVWAPVEVSQEGPFERMLQLSFEAYRGRALWHPVYFDGEAVAALEPIPPQLKLERRGRYLVTESFLIQTSAYLEALMRGVELKVRAFSAAEELLELEEEAWVNCLGAGAGPLFRDERLIPIRGQLVRLPALEQCFTLIHETGYLISRPDVLLAGGTFEKGVGDPTPDPVTCQLILERNRAYFDRS